jgi:DNA-binding beta-propeller fold protein YncE
VFDKKTGKFITRFGGKGDGEANLTKPEGISVDPNGNIFVADYTTGDVKVYDKNYKWLKTFSEYGSAPGQNIKSEFTDVRFGRYYMPEAGNHRISVWDLNGKFLFTWGKKGSGPGEFKAPAGVAIDKDDNIYVSEIGNNRVQVFDKTGKFLTMWGKKGSGTGEFGNLHGIYCDKSTGWIYVADTANNRIQVFKPAG